MPAQAKRIQLFEQACDLSIDIGDLEIIGVHPGPSLGEGGRRFVGDMRIEVMHPCEEGLLLVTASVEPLREAIEFYKHKDLREFFEIMGGLIFLEISFVPFAFAKLKSQN